ncbi:hypothetical protein Poli38472_011937 [Pythium oligandrum]|uniref:CP-type G domain-containing protein n=1 Tax=Pythium oligandrum TaxID=41045 RepID=A0A8K1CQG3_PYTOL|nr:hypothetical protein Poli38472_011937 [Pythium oligandrum]|eukprot:TMW66821.1 hypothetical protein Poli38472_011937 [Pythium oligandrum]
MGANPRKQSKQKGRGPAKAKGSGRKEVKRNGLSSALSGGSATANRPAAHAPPKMNASKKLTAQKLQQKRDELRTMKVNRHRLQASSLEELMGNAAKTAQVFERNQEAKEADGDQNGLEINDNSRRAYMKELRKVVDRADVILEVLDARDPMGCRTMDMEEAIGNRSGKKIVLVLNKIDLVPPHVLQPWLNYLRTFYPTVAFKASTQQQTSRLSANTGRADKASTDMVSGSKAVGTDALMQLLKNYCRNNHIKTAITVGVIGYPNVGKSSVINSLKRSKAASVSSVAGHTKVMQEIHIDSKIKLLDCPGIVFDHSDSDALLLRNCINTETMADPVSAVQVILSRCEPAQMVQLYGLNPQTKFQDVIEFLVLVAQAKGKLGKGGIPDRHSAARIILQDWNRGKIPFFTPPPDQKHTILDTQIVSSFSDEFDLDRVLNPTSIFLSEEAEAADDQDMATSGPKCSLDVPSIATDSSIAMQAEQSAASRMRDLMKTLGDSDSDSDMDSDGLDSDDDDDDNDDGAMYKVPDVSLQQLTSKAAQDHLNPQTALMARRKAKLWRKLKRRAARQQIGQAQESELREQLEGMDFQMSDDESL